MVYLRPSLGRFPYLSSDFSDTDILQLLKVSPNQQANHQTFRVVLDLSSMSKRRNFLTTYGTLHTCVVEAVDLIETTSSSNKKVKVTKCNVFAVLKVIDEAGTDIRHYNTETHPFYTSESLVIGEEFIFENVSSAHSLLVSFFSVSLEKEKAPHAPVTVAQNCLGFTQIPLSRLEDGVSILQWHQLFSPSNLSEGLRSAVRIECNFASEAAVSNKTGSTMIRRTGSVARHGSEYNSNGASRGSMYFDDYVDEMVEDEADASEDDSSHSSNDYDDFNHESEPSRERVFVRVAATANNKSANTSPVKHSESHQEVKNHDFGDDDVSSAIIHDGKGQATAGEEEEGKKEDGENVKLETGLIDYCIILGPAEPFSLLKPTHYITSSGALASLTVTPSADLYSTKGVMGPNSPQQSSPYTGLFGENGNGGGGGSGDSSNEEQEIVIWDRLPRHDHFDIEMPSKLEWFACPEGSKTVLYHKRPDPYYQSFVLSSGGETEEVFGLSINFFMELGSFSALDLGAIVKEKKKGTEDGEEEDEKEGHSHNHSHTSLLPGEDVLAAWWRQVRRIDPNSNVGFFPAESASDLGIGLDFDEHSKKYTQGCGHGGVGAGGGGRGGGGESTAQVNPDKLWTVVSLCVLFRASQHVQQLRKCLEYAYYESILPHLCVWEAQWEALVREKATAARQTEAVAHDEDTVGFSHDDSLSLLQVNSPAQLSAMLASTFKASFSPFSLHIERLMATLCLECPVPIPGFLTVKLQFPRKVSAPAVDRNTHFDRNGLLGTPRCWRGNSESIHTIGDAMLEVHNPHNRAKSVEFSAPSPEDFPRCSYPLEVLLKCFGPRVLIDIVCCVLSECRILFHSSDLALLPVICEGLRTLIYPLQWTHVYLPVVPMHLLNVVEAPVPFMLGTHSRWLKYIQIEYMNDMVLVDCDTAALDMGGSLAMQFPEREDRWLMTSLRTIMQPILPNNEVRELCHPLLGRPKSKADEILGAMDTNTKIQLVFYDVLFHLLRYVPDCLFYLNPSCPVFNRPLFISDYASDEYRPALELLTVTNCFHVLTESIHTPSLAFFYKNIVRLTELEKKLMDQALAAEEAGISPTSAADSSGTGSNNSSQLSLSTPLTRGGRGQLQRGFTRNVSVANIIYDKLVSVSSPGASPQIGAQRTAGGASGKDGAVEDKPVDSPKIIQHTGRGLMRHVSIIGMSEAKEGTPGKSFFAPNSISAGSQETQNEIAYASLLPTWLLKPTLDSGATAAAPAKVDSIRVLLAGRLKHYQPHLKLDKSSIHRDKPPASPKNAEALLKMSSDAVRAFLPDYTLVVQATYSVHDPVPAEAAGTTVAKFSVVTNNASRINSFASPEVNIKSPTLLAASTPTSTPTPRPALVRAGSAHSTPRSSSGASVKFAGLPRQNSKGGSFSKKGGTSFSFDTESIKGPGMAHPVLNAVPSFRRMPVPISTSPKSPPSPLSRVFHSTRTEEEESDDEVGFGSDGSDDVDTPQSFNLAGKYTPAARPAAFSGKKPTEVPEGPTSPVPIPMHPPIELTEGNVVDANGDNAGDDGDDDIGNFGKDSTPDLPALRSAFSVTVPPPAEQSADRDTDTDSDEDIGHFGEESPKSSTPPAADFAVPKDGHLVSVTADEDDDVGNFGGDYKAVTAEEREREDRMSPLTTPGRSPRPATGGFGGFGDDDVESDHKNDVDEEEDSEDSGERATFGHDGDEDDNEDEDEEHAAATTAAQDIARPLIEFDEEVITAAQLQVKRWTVADLAHELQVPGASMLIIYSKMRSAASSRLCENTQFAARHRAINSGNKQNKRSLLNPADTQATFDKLSKMNNQQCDECITLYLQKVVTESILEEHWLESALQSCLKALQDKNNRRCLIDMLRNAKQTKDKRQPVSNVYPLNPAAFEAFSKLFTGVLRICSNQEDYLCAYGLLEVGGLYFRFVVHDDNMGDTGGTPQQDEIMEFLSERSCQHPIYHNSALWCELMKSRVPIPTSSTPAVTGATNGTTATPPAKSTRPIINTVLSEVHSLLFIMLELEVNSSRALLFIQGVASDYSLGINDYYKLQRFVNRIWANNHVDEHAAQSAHEQVNAHSAALHKPDHHTMSMKKRSKENLRDRRASMSIGDMLTMQGHNNSRLFRQSSMEEIRGGLTRGMSIKLRTQSIGGMEPVEGGGLGFGGTGAGVGTVLVGGSRSAKHISSSPKPAVRRGSLGSMSMDEADAVAGSNRKNRSKSLHSNNNYNLSIDTSSDPKEEDNFNLSASIKNKSRTPALYPRGLPTPIRGRLDQIDEHNTEAGEDFSRHSDHVLRSAVSVTSEIHSDSDQHSHEVDSSNPSSPRLDGGASAGAGHSFHSGVSLATAHAGHTAHTTSTGTVATAEDSRSLDEMLGLHRVSSAMLMRTSSMVSGKHKSTSFSNIAPFEAPKNVPNKFAPLELTGREEGSVTAFDCVNSWLVTGAEDGALNITDLTTGACTTKFRHGSGSGDRYRGITSIHCMSTPCQVSKNNLFFSGCSNGIVKAWVIPQNGAPQGNETSAQSSSPSTYWGFRMNLRLKQSLAVIKVHAAPITALIAKPSEQSAGWLLASGDEKGVVCMTRGTDNSSSTTCCSTTIQVGATKAGVNGGAVPPRPTLSTGKISISCLSFIGTPAVSVTADHSTTTAKGKGAKKAGPVPNSVSVGAVGAGGGGSGTEEYLGVGTSTGLISVLDIHTAVPIYQVAGHTARVTQLIGLRANEFISCSMDRSIKLWDIRTRNRPTHTFAGKILEERSLGPNNYRKCAASPITAIAVGGGDNSLVISTSADGVVRLWDRRYDVNVPCCVTQGHSNRITSIAWNGVDEFHTASHDGTVRTWDSINGQNTAMLQAFDEEGITAMRMTTFKCAQHITITPRGPVTFTDHDKLSTRTCIVASGWNGTIKSFVHDV